MSFVQIIEFKTSQLDAMLELDKKWRAGTEGKRTASSVTMTKDRDRPDTYIWMIEFPSYEAAMRNNDLPETQEIAQGMMKLAEGQPVFRNLEVTDRKTL